MHASEAEVALERFLSHALVRKKERLLGFITNPNTRSKFLDAIYHDLVSCLDTTRSVSSLPAKALASPGFRFEPPDKFGIEVSSLCAVSAIDESFLVVSADSNDAIYGPETYIDDRMYFSIS